MQKLKTFLILNIIFLTIATGAKAELSNNMPADVVVGQRDFTSNQPNQGQATCGANTLNESDSSVFSDGARLFIADITSNRVLIYNSIPTNNNANADVVIGQQDFNLNTPNDSNGDGIQDANPSANTLWSPRHVFFDGARLFICDGGNRRVLIYNGIPTTNGASADVVVGQDGFTSRISGTAANRFKNPVSLFSDKNKLYVCDLTNYRVLIFNNIPTTNGTSADVVIGQPDMVSGSPNQGVTCGANTLNYPYGVFVTNGKLLISDRSNSRVLIYNTIPVASNANADLVVGQPDFKSCSTNQGVTVGANTLANPRFACSDGKRLFVNDGTNNRVLIYKNIPITNNTSADIVIGQPDFASNTFNYNGVSSRSLNKPHYSIFDGKRLYVFDCDNSRVLIYNIGGSSIELGPQFEQGKAVLGKVFDDKNSNGIQDEGEKGLEGVKVASDTGIYAITDSDGKYHFPYIETGQRLLKIDSITLPEGSIFTTDNPYKTTVTKGILSKVSFGIKLPQLNKLNEPNKPNEPLLKVSITQDPVLLKPRLTVSTAQDKNNVIFSIDCNYYLFVTRSELTFYDQNYKKIKTMPLPNPIPSKYSMPCADIFQEATYYQLSVFDKNNREDRTGIGILQIK